MASMDGSLVLALLRCLCAAQTDPRIVAHFAVNGADADGLSQSEVVVIDSVVYESVVKPAFEAAGFSLQRFKGTP